MIRSLVSVSPTAYGRWKLNVLNGRAFDTVWAAALAYARHLGPAKSAAALQGADECGRKWGARAAMRAINEPRALQWH